MLGAYIGYKIRLQKKPIVFYSQATVVSIDHPKIKISYEGNEIKNLHAYNMVFWNKGSSEIRKSDIPALNGPHFKAPKNGKILSASKDASNISSNISIEINDDSSKAFFNFDFINQNEGFSSQILYSKDNIDEKIKANQL